MAIKNLYPNLPGHLVEFKDGGLKLTSTDEPTGYRKSLLILGTAFDGPVNEPVRIDEKTVVQLFGSDVNDKGYPNGATLTKYAKQAFKNGFGDVRCMRVTGSQAYIDIDKTVETVTEQFDADTVYATAEGTADIELVLPHTPVVEGSVNITDENGLVVGNIVEPYTGKVTLKGLVSKNASLTVDYKYLKIEPYSEAEIDSFAVGDTTSIAKLDDLYVTPKAGDAYVDGATILTDGPTLHADGATLVEGVDYQISGTTITFLKEFLNGYDISFYTKEEVASGESKELSDMDQDVPIEKLPVDGTVVVKQDGVTMGADTYVVDTTDPENMKVILKAGSFIVNGMITIDYKYEVSTTYKESMTVRAIYGGSVYKDATITITQVTNEAGEDGRRFLFMKPESKKFGNGDKPFYFDSFDCPTVGVLRQALKDYPLNNVFEIVCDDDDMPTNDFPAFSSALTEGGDDGVVVTNNELFEALSGKRNDEGYLIEQGAYQILENYHVDYIYPAGVYADAKQTVNKYSDFHQELALLCAVLTYRTKMTHGFIDVKPNSNTTLVGIQNHVAKLAALPNLHYMRDQEGNDIVDSEGNKMDIGWYTSLVVGPEPVMVSDTLGTYYGSPAIAYAALCASISPQSAPTNKALPGVNGMKYKFSNKQMDMLTGNRMVCFRLKNEGTTTASSKPYVVDGCTAGNPNCDYKRISTVKVVTDVVDQVREVADPFIGEPNTVEQRNALAALISKRLTYLLEQGEIQHYEFEINATIQQVLIGECTIALTLVCPMELRKITTVVALRAAA